MEKFPAATARRYVPAIAVAAIGVALSLLTWTRALEERQLGVSNVLGSLADETTGTIEAQLDREVNALRDLATFWQLHGLLPDGPWQSDTRMILEHFNGIQWIAWVPADSTKTRFVVRDTTVRVDAEEIGLARLQRAAASALIRDNWSSAYELHVFLPVGSPSESVGVLAARIQMDSLWLKKRTPAARSLSVKLTSDKGEELLLRQGAGPAPEWMTLRRVFTSPAGTAVQVELAPWPEYVRQIATPWPHYFLLTGLFLSLSIGVVLFQFLRTQDYSEVLARANRDLDARLVELSRRDRELRELNEALELRVQSRTAELSEALREVETFSHSASHDLRSPIGAILNFAAVLEEDYGPSLDVEGRRLLERMRAAGQRANQLLNALVEFAASGASPNQPSPVDVRPIVEGAYAEAVAGEGPAADVRFSVGELPPAYADGVQVHRVFVNLIGNALKYSRGRPVREVQVGGLRDTVESTYWVRDNGPGFEPSRAPEMFEPFKRLHAGKVEGSGLGLAIVAKIVRHQGGRVWAESDGKAGATFYFTLPTRKRESDDEAGDPAGR